jgi:hypothetical protein
MLDSVGSFRSLWEMADYLIHHLTSPTITIYFTNTSPTVCSTYPVLVCQPAQVSFHMLLVSTESVVYDTPLVCVPACGI